ncbi:unnamed protein product [Eruca vesicaria subsp. sativa]|uniref:S-protein homolog n=1 Tax=Eruca vesicaria subsp. sativa TaxID=29727 RepID=A0ABC8K1C8_ERUVS|nr:unnamed protein product [Eruca vesicaria subsp. sativa]
MDVTNNVVKTLARWCLVLQAIMISFNTVALKEPDYVNMYVTIRNAITGLIRPEIVYRCQEIPAIHICHVWSALGTATLVIENTYLDAEMCPKSSCAHEATPKGILFRGLEWDFKTVFPKLKPVEYLELPWTPWPNRT